MAEPLRALLVVAVGVAAGLWLLGAPVVVLGVVAAVFTEVGRGHVASRVTVQRFAKAAAEEGFSEGLAHAEAELESWYFGGEF